MKRWQARPEEGSKIFKPGTGGTEKKDRSEGEPDHAASPLMQEPEGIDPVRFLERFGAKRQKEKTWP